MLEHAIAEDARKLSGPSGRVEDYWTREDYYQRFLIREVELLAVYENEKLHPNNDVRQTVLVGGWTKYSDTDLYVRAGMDIRFGGLVLAKRNNVDKALIWGYTNPIRCQAIDEDTPYEGRFHLFEPNYGISLGKLKRVCTIIDNFLKTIDTYRYGTVKSAS